MKTHNHSSRKILKQLKKNSAVKEARSFDYNKDGSVQITVGLKEAEDFYSPYSYLTYEFMNPEVRNYIEMYESNIPIDKSVSVDIYTETPTTQEDKKRIRKTVKRHYAEEILATEKKYKRQTIKSILFSILGLGLLLAEAIIYSFFVNMYLDTIIAVIGWLFLWDGFEILLYDRAELKRKLIRQYRLLNAKVHIRQYSQKIKRAYGLDEEDDEENDD